MFLDALSIYSISLTQTDKDFNRLEHVQNDDDTKMDSRNLTNCEQ